MALTSKELRTNAKIHELQRVLSTARGLMEEMERRHKIVLAERDNLLSRNTEMWHTFREVRRSWAFFLLPRRVRKSIQEEAGRAD